MEPTKELFDQLEREEVQDPRRMSFAQKFLGGAALFDYAWAISFAGIRRQHPDFDDEQVKRERHFEPELR